MRVTTATILAAGLGSRLKNHTHHIPKGFLSLGGMSLIERSCRQLVAHGIQRIVIGTGYLSNVYDSFASSFTLARVECIRNDHYASSGSMCTLYNLCSVLDEPFLLLESDLLYEDKALRLLLNMDTPDLILASGFTGSGDEVYLQLDAQSKLIAASKDRQRLSSIDAELVGISKLSMHTYDLACKVMENKASNEPRLDYEQALVEVSRDFPIKVLREEHLIWCEIDDEANLEHAKNHILPRLHHGFR